MGAGACSPLPGRCSLTGRLTDRRCSRSSRYEPGRLGAAQPQRRAGGPRETRHPAARCRHGGDHRPPRPGPWPGWRAAGMPRRNSAGYGVTVSPDSSKVYVTGDTATYGTTIGYGSWEETTMRRTAGLAALAWRRGSGTPAGPAPPPPSSSGPPPWTPSAPPSARPAIRARPRTTRLPLHDHGKAPG